MANVLIATLGESPIVVSSMVHALQTQKNLTIDELHVIYPRGDKFIDFGYDLLKEHLNGTCTVSESTLPFPDVNSHEASIEFLRILSESIQTHEDVGDHVYLSLAGGRKNMSALMAATCQFFECVRGLYHILDKYENDTTKQNFHSLEALINDPKRSAKLSPPANELILVEIPYEQSTSGVALWQYFSEIASNPDAQPPIQISDELEDWGLEIRQRGGTDVFDVYLSKNAYNQFINEIKDNDIREKFMNCFRSMKNSVSLRRRSRKITTANSDGRRFKLGNTAERPIYYRTNRDVVVCELTEKNTTYQAFCNGNLEVWEKDHDKFIHANELQLKTKADSILIAPLGKTPMVVTQTFVLLSEIEGVDIEKVIVIYPNNAEIHNGVQLLKTAFGNRFLNRTLTCIQIDDIQDVASTDDCNVYLEKLTEVITEERAGNPNINIHLSLSGGRKGMAALTLFGAQKANIDAVYHTLIMDVDLEEQIERETTLTELDNLSRRQQVERLSLEIYDQSQFELIRVPVIPI